MEMDRHTGEDRFQIVPSGLDRDDFVARYGWVYEHSPWIAERLHAAGLGPEHDTVDGLHRALARIVDEAGPEAQLGLIRAHPDLAGRLAVAGELTQASSAEQAGAGLDQCTAAEFRCFQALNADYKARFGFPFILTVAGKSRAEILEVFEQRIDNSANVELGRRSSRCTGSPCSDCGPSLDGAGCGRERPEVC